MPQTPALISNAKRPSLIKLLPLARTSREQRSLHRILLLALPGILAPWRPLGKPHRIRADPLHIIQETIIGTIHAPPSVEMQLESLQLAEVPEMAEDGHEVIVVDEAALFVGAHARIETGHGVFEHKGHVADEGEV